MGQNLFAHMCGVGLTGWLCGRVGQCPDGSSPYPEWVKCVPGCQTWRRFCYLDCTFIFSSDKPITFPQKVALSSLTLWWCHRYLKSLSYHPSSTDKWCPHSGRCPDTGWWRWRPHHWGHLLSADWPVRNKLEAWVSITYSVTEYTGFLENEMLTSWSEDKRRVFL